MSECKSCAERASQHDAPTAAMIQLRLSEHQLKGFKTLVQSLNKIGSEAHIEVHADKVVLLTSNSAKTCSLFVTLQSTFFEAFTFDGQPLKTAVLLKHLLFTFRTQKILSYQVDLTTDTCDVTVEGELGVRKHFRLRCVDDEGEEDIRDRLQVEEYVVCLVAEIGELNRLLSTFAGGQAEVSLVAYPQEAGGGPPCLLQSYNDPNQAALEARGGGRGRRGGRKARGDSELQRMHTEVELGDATRSFMSYTHTGQAATEATFNLPDFKVMCAMCEALQANLLLRVHSPGVGMIMEPHFHMGPGAMSATMLLSTLPEWCIVGGDEAAPAPHPQPRAQLPQQQQPAQARVQQLQQREQPQQGRQQANDGAGQRDQGQRDQGQGQGARGRWAGAQQSNQQQARGGEEVGFEGDDAEDEDRYYEDAGGADNGEEELGQEQGGVAGGTRAGSGGGGGVGGLGRGGSGRSRGSGASHLGSAGDDGDPEALPRLPAPLVAGAAAAAAPAPAPARAMPAAAAPPAAAAAGYQQYQPPAAAAAHGSTGGWAAQPATNQPQQRPTWQQPQPPHQQPPSQHQHQNPGWQQAPPVQVAPYPVAAVAGVQGPGSEGTGVGFGGGNRAARVAPHALHGQFSAAVSGSAGGPSSVGLRHGTTGLVGTTCGTGFGGGTGGTGVPATGQGLWQQPQVAGGYQAHHQPEPQWQQQQYVVPAPAVQHYQQYAAHQAGHVPSPQQRPSAHAHSGYAATAAGGFAAAPGMQGFQGAGLPAAAAAGVGQQPVVGYGGMAIDEEDDDEVLAATPPEEGVVYSGPAAIE